MYWFRVIHSMKAEWEYEQQKGDGKKGGDGGGPVTRSPGSPRKRPLKQSERRGRR